MAAINPKAGWTGNSFDPPINRANFFYRVLKAALSSPNLQMSSSSSGDKPQSASDFIRDTGVDDIEPTKQEISREKSEGNSQDKIKMFRQIFIDHLDEIEGLPNLRESILRNINRMIDCGNPRLGGTMYGCPTCGQVKFSPFHCGSRFCPSCGNMYNMKRANAMMEKVIDVPHRHITFTIPAELRDFFRIDRDALNDLFTAVKDTLYFVMQRSLSINDLNEDYVPGFICVLHTFGRDLKWNPHIHVLFCTMLVGNTKKKKIFLPYALLRKSFQRCLFTLLKQRYGKPISKLISKLYNRYQKGLYVHAPDTTCDTLQTVKYIGRYLGRPVIASSRIDSYDGENVTFHYKRHEDGKLVSETIPALDFIKKLIIHIPDSNFKMVRYYGFYASETANRKKRNGAKLGRLLNPIDRALRHEGLRWRFAMINAFNTDPLKCSACGDIMEPIYFSCGEKTYFFPDHSRSRSMDVRLKQLLSFCEPLRNSS